MNLEFKKRKMAGQFDVMNIHSCPFAIDCGGEYLFQNEKIPVWAREKKVDGKEEMTRKTEQDGHLKLDVFFFLFLI